MTLTAIIIDQHQQVRPFNYISDELEAGLDCLSLLVGKGFTLRQVKLLDGSSTMELPITIFDGSLFSRPMRMLELDYRRQLLVRS